MHAPFDRRRFLLALGAATAAGTLPRVARAAMGPNDKFDLLIKGGEVLDPSQGLRGVRDIGIRNGVIEAVQADIPAERALKVLSATGRLVTPGLVDLHAHTFPYGSAIGIPADELVPFQGTTTAVSAGDAGANNSPRSAASSSARRARASTRSCTSPTWAWPAFPSPSFITSTSRNPKPRRAPS